MRHMQQQKPASAAPLGCFAFALTTALLQGAITAITDDNTNFYVFTTGMFYGGIAQFVAGMWAFRRGEVFPATAYSSFGASWMSYALYGILLEAGLFRPSTRGLQMQLCLWGVVSFFFFLASLATNLTLQLLFGTLTALYYLLAAGVTNDTANKVGGWLGLVTSGIAFYAGLADLLGEIFGTVVLPVGLCRPGVALLPYFQAGLGQIPWLGPMYTRAVERENSARRHDRKRSGGSTSDSREVEEGSSDVEAPSPKDSCLDGAASGHRTSAGLRPAAGQLAP